jgi:antitoxin component YwqK of YwqJK toxin-antitoxin module
MKMRLKLFSLLIVFLPLLGFAQEAPNKTDASGKKQGHWIKFDKDKKKVYDGNFTNDIPVGKFTYYYPTGELKAITIFSKNGTVARTKMYNLSGKVMGEGKYIDEKKDSIWKFYDEEGVLISDENYTSGLREGNSKIYYRNGQVAEEKNWKAGILNGPKTKYFEEGQVKYKGQYINGKVEGKVTFYHSSGKVDAEGIYKNDLKEGPWKYYTEDGKLKRTDMYKDGKLTSPDPNVIPNEQLEKEKQKYQDYQLKNPAEENYSPN